MVQFETKAIHGDFKEKDPHRAVRFPIYAGAAHYFDTAEDLEDAFAFRKPAYVYSRIANPTVSIFEQKMNALEEGLGAVAVASGMAAISNTLLCLLRQGENIVTARALFGNTYSLLLNVLQPFGIDVRFVDFDDLSAVESAMDKNTRIVFMETISNPKMIVHDIQQISEIAHQKGAIVVVDSTLTTPFLFKAKSYGVDIAVHSSTKLISGGATSIGGVIIDLGNHDWERVPALDAYRKYGEFAFLGRLRKEVYRDLGACMAPQTAYLQNLGLETLSLRIEKVCKNALLISEFIKEMSSVKAVYYPGLADSPYHKIATRLFEGHFGGVLSFELMDKRSCFDFLNRLKIIKRATNLGDNTSLILHPESTIYREFSKEEKRDMGVTDQLIRLSAGIENIKDLMGDIDQAIHKL